MAVPRPLVIRSFLQWSGWSMQDYLSTPFDTVTEWMEAWTAEVQYQNQQQTDNGRPKK